MVNSTIKHAVVATDIVLFTLKESELLVRLYRMQHNLFPDRDYSLPGGLINPDETADQAVRRHIKNKTLIESRLYTEQLYSFSETKRDPRGRVVSIAYLGLVPWDKLSDNERDGWEDSIWTPLEKAKGLGYDHDQILKVGLERLRSKIGYTSIISQLLPDEFTLTELEKAYETILNIGVDKRNFRKKILKIGILKNLGKKRSEGAHRPAELYSFITNEIKQINMI